MPSDNLASCRAAAALCCLALAAARAIAIGRISSAGLVPSAIWLRVASRIRTHLAKLSDARLSFS